MGPFMNVDTSALVGPFKIMEAGIRRWLWAHSDISTLLLRWAHSGLSTPVFGGGYGPIQVHRHCCFGGPIQDCRHCYSAVAMGPFRYDDVARRAHSGLSTPVSAVAMGPFMNVDTPALVGPFRIVDAGIRRWRWAHSGISTLLLRWAHSGLSTPVSAVAMGPFMNVDTSALVGPFRIVDTGIRRWLWAHSGISTLLLWWAHSGLSPLFLGGGYGPIQICRRCSAGPFRIIDACIGGGNGPIHECRYLCFGGPIQDCRRRYLALAMGPFSYIVIANSVGPFRIIGDIIWRRLWAHS